MSPLQKQLFSQFNICGTKHPHIEHCHHYFYAVEGTCLKLPGCTTQTLLKSHSALSWFCVPLRILSCKWGEFCPDFDRLCALPVLLLALRKQAKVAIPHLYFPLLKGEKHYFIVLVFQNLFFQKTNRVTLPNRQGHRPPKLKNFLSYFNSC